MGFSTNFLDYFNILDVDRKFRDFLEPGDLSLHRSPKKIINPFAKIESGTYPAFFTFLLLSIWSFSTQIWHWSSCSKKSFQYCWARSLWFLCWIRDCSTIGFLRDLWKSICSSWVRTAQSSTSISLFRCIPNLIAWRFFFIFHLLNKLSCDF